MKTLNIIDLGSKSYQCARDIQKRICENIKSGLSGDALILVEHPNVITIGSAGKINNIIAADETISNMGFEILRTDRGGDVTLHAPGQIVAYPLFDLRRHKKDIRRFIKKLERVFELTAKSFNLIRDRSIDLTGLWVDGKKIGFIGIGIRHWITFHGMSLNVNNDLGHFSTIKPCGIDGLTVTSLSELLGKPVSIEYTKNIISDKFCEVFGFDYTNKKNIDARLVKEKTS